MFAKKSLGQNFLKDQRFLQKIFHSANLTENTQTIVEIGPGMGALTKLLLQHKKPLYCIEKDQRLVEYLQKYFQGINNLHIIHADALEFDFSQIPGKKILIANLPYNISVPLIINYLENTSLFEKYCVLIQKEVACRLAGKVGTADYGRLAVLSQAYCKVNKHFEIPGTAFQPTTKVTSTFITLEPLLNNNINFNKLSLIVEKAFSQRRKMLRGVLKKYPNLEPLFSEEEKTLRAEQISVEEFVGKSKLLDG